MCTPLKKAFQEPLASDIIMTMSFVKIPEEEAHKM